MNAESSLYIYSKKKKKLARRPEGVFQRLVGGLVVLVNWEIIKKHLSVPQKALPFIFLILIFRQ
jgi:hypothetical protein